MKKLTILLGALAALAAVPALATSDDKALTGAAIGAGAGAVVAGPVGAVVGGGAGAIIGGPNLPKKVEVHRHRIYWHDKDGHRHWRWSE